MRGESRNICRKRCFFMKKWEHFTIVIGGYYSRYWVKPLSFSCLCRWRLCANGNVLYEDLVGIRVRHWTCAVQRELLHTLHSSTEMLMVLLNTKMIFIDMNIVLCELWNSRITSDEARANYNVRGGPYEVVFDQRGCKMFTTRDQH